MEEGREVRLKRPEANPESTSSALDRGLHLVRREMSLTMQADSTEPAEHRPEKAHAGQRGPDTR